ncbi:hypothetical protein [Ohtaekwangia sp.]|jgi:hypothetical protein|uniref:hypothetical protein n=1 Tax=Ohtaekwangia sp. TaxID=2066019 RepID=UPI002FDE63A1
MKKLTTKEKATIRGGVSRGEYCSTLKMIMDNNTRTSAMYAAWGTNCAPYGHQNIQ